MTTPDFERNPITVARTSENLLRAYAECEEAYANAFSPDACIGALSKHGYAGPREWDQMMQWILDLRRRALSAPTANRESERAIPGCVIDDQGTMLEGRWAQTYGGSGICFMLTKDAAAAFAARRNEAADGR